MRVCACGLLRESIKCVIPEYKRATKRVKQCNDCKDKMGDIVVVVPSLQGVERLVSSRLRRPADMPCKRRTPQVTIATNIEVERRPPYDSARSSRL